MITALATIFAGLLGLAFGSFLNVCASRWPEGESAAKGRSRCRSCGRTLAWWENVPLVSWIALRGRCRTCKAWIGWRYPLVELAVGALWAYCARIWFALVLLPGVTVSFCLICFVDQAILLWLLVALATLDVEELWLPDFLTWPGMALGLLSNYLFFLPIPGSFNWLPWIPSERLRCLVYYSLSAAGAALLILLIRWVYKLLRKREGLGLGDAKLMAMIAAWLGLEGALLAFSIGCVLGAITALLLLALPSSRKDEPHWALKKLPLGTFLCIGAIVSVFWGPQLIALYERWAGF